MKVILYKSINISVLIPAIENIDISIIAQKDVPAGIPYLIVDISILPNEPQETWEVDFSNPDGYGLTKKEFEVKYPQYKGWAVVE